MREVVYLDARRMTDKEALHPYLQEQFGLPAHYGKNLDALWDCLTTDFREQLIVIRDPFMVEEQLGRYGKTLLRLFQDLEQANRHVRVVRAYPFDRER